MPDKKWKNKKCKKCGKKVSRNGKWVKHKGAMHNHCWKTWKKKRLRKEADKEWSKAVHRKYGSMCEITGGYADQTHHYFPKGKYPQLRYHIDNGIPVSKGGHFRIENGDPTTHERIKSNRGQEWYEKLEEKSKEEIPSGRGIEYYKEQVERLKNYEA